MDVTTTIRQLIAALLEGDRRDALTLTEALASWLEKDGFIPESSAIILTLEDLCERYQ
jgi:replication-associated recombination protein RarA